MTVGKMGLVLCRMIEHGMVQALVSTGALMAHGLTEAIGLAHYVPPPGVSDEELFRRGYNRVYDTLEMERNLNDVERVVHEALERLGDGAPLCSEVFCREVGRILSERGEGPGVLRSAYERGVPCTSRLHGLGDRPRRRHLGPGTGAPAAGGAELDIWSVVPPSTASSTSCRTRAASRRRGRWGSSPSAAGSRATGPSRSAPSWTSWSTASASG